jgi:hypothetical protein
VIRQLAEFAKDRDADRLSCTQLRDSNLRYSPSIVEGGKTQLERGQALIVYL